MSQVRDIELHTAYYVEHLMSKDRYKGVDPVALSGHYFYMAMEIDHALAIELNAMHGVSLCSAI